MTDTPTPETPATPPPGPASAGLLANPKVRWVLRLVRDLGIGLVLLMVALPVVGWLRAPDLPDEAPDFTLQTVDGETVSLDDYAGQKVVLNFWATWCGPCRAEIPFFSHFARHHPDVVVLGIAVDGTPAQLKAAGRKMGIDYPILVGDRATISAYGASTLPTTVIVDEEGDVSTVHVGVMTGPHLWFATR